MQYFRHEMLYQKCSFCLNMTLLIEILNKRIARTEYLSAYFVKKQNENGHIYLMIINVTVFHNDRFVLSLSLFLLFCYSIMIGFCFFHFTLYIRANRFAFMFLF